MQIIKPCWYKNNEIKGHHDDSPLIAHVPKTLKRRLGNIGFNVISVMNLCTENSEADDMIWVISSRHGDTNRMIRLFQNVCDNDLLSPTDFSMSVHNALPGMHSIQTNNTSMHTAISGGVHSFALGLLEAYVLLKTKNQKIGYLYYDFQLPDAYSALEIDNQESLIIGMTLDNNDQSDFYLNYNDTNKDQNIFNINDLISFFCHNRNKCIIPMPSGQFIISK